VIAPEELIKKYGSEILRLWVAGEDYRDNIRLSNEILQRLTEAYRRIRNTNRFLLGNLNDFDPDKDSILYGEMEELDRWALNRLQEMNESVLKAYNDFEFHLVYHRLHNFCVIDLSSFYLDIIKDRLYVSAKNSHARRSGQTAMNEILNVLVRLMAPIMSFTADEIWQFMDGQGNSPSVHTDLFVPVKEEYRDRQLGERWEEIIKIRREVTRALEITRKEKKIGHSLDASITLGVSAEIEKILNPYREQLRSIFIVSSVQIKPFDEVNVAYESDEVKGLIVKVVASEDKKCERCWVHDPSVGENKIHPMICRRCIDALKEMRCIQR
ncbi:MAG: class I tRNA ligase family protein, partial [Deltaproteobacteria bacterium]|nr:class I tRNA ligase family protein [Deltaproteobacteria bacterium]